MQHSPQPVLSPNQAVGNGIRDPARLSASHRLRAQGAHNIAGAVTTHATMPDTALPLP